MAKIYHWNDCPDCGAAIGELHDFCCDVELCPHCGGQALGCEKFDPDDSRRAPWTGYWPGTETCLAFGWFSRWDLTAGNCVRCESDHPDAGPDLNRIVKECQWNADHQCWERRH